MLQYISLNNVKGNGGSGKVEEKSKRRHVTKSCIACKARHHRCSGTTPCSYCEERDQPCVYDTQAKRGPKKKRSSTLPSPINTTNPPNTTTTNANGPFIYTPETNTIDSITNNIDQEINNFNPHASCPSSLSSFLSSILNSNNPINTNSNNSNGSDNDPTRESGTSQPYNINSLGLIRDRIIGSQLQTFNNKELSLWNENERIASVNTFFELRSWWKALLDQEALRRADTRELHAQNLIIGAQIFRYHKNKDGASQLYSAAKQMMETLDDVSIEYVCSRVLMLEFEPSQLKVDSLRSVWAKAKNMETRTIRQRRVFLVAKMYTSEIEKDRGSFTFDLEGESDIWGILNAFFYRIIRILYVGDLKYDIDDLAKIKEHQIPAQECEQAIQDLNMMDWILMGNKDTFGPEFQVVVPSLKAMCYWKLGKLNEAITEAVKFLCEFRSFGDSQVFLAEILYTSSVLLVFHEAGMMNLVREGLDLLAPVAFATDQHEIYQQIVGFFLSPKPRAITINPVPPKPNFIANPCNTLHCNTEIPYETNSTQAPTIENVHPWTISEPSATAVPPELEFLFQ